MLSGESVTAILVAATGFVGAAIVALRGLSGDRFQRRVTESATLLSGYTEMVAALRRETEAIRVAHSAEIERQTHQHQADLDKFTALHNAERERWSAERTRLEERIETLEAQVVALIGRADDRGRPEPTGGP